MSASKILYTRQILGSIASMTSMTAGAHSIRQHMSKASINCVRNQQSATYLLVHASRALAAAQDDKEIEELEAPVPMPMPVRRTECLPIKRGEMEQRKLTKAQSLEALKNLHSQKLPEVQRIPFKLPSASEGNISSRRYACVEDLLKTMTEPHQLASEVVSLSQELTIEKDKNKRLLESYHELLEQVTLKPKRNQ